MRKNIFIVIGLILIVTVVLFFMTTRTARPKGLVAFVIDDWGYNTKNLELLLDIERPITISILPNLRYSSQIAEEVTEKGRMHDIILHLPLESKSNKTPEPNTIRCDMKEDRILSILRSDLENVPRIAGVSNHQGSKATGDKRVMKIILAELKKRRLFFLDSLTTPDSVCSDIAGRIKLRFAERDVFLDLTDRKNSKEIESYVKRQVQKTARIALEEGSAIAIGHDKAITLKVIKDSIPKLETQGIKIVPLKELAR